MDENSVVQEFIAATSLPAEMVYALLANYAQEFGIDTASLTLEDLRKITAFYLTEVFGEIA